MARGASFASLLGRRLGVIVLLSGLLGACGPATPNVAAPAVTPSPASTPPSAPDNEEPGITVIATQTATLAPSPAAEMTATATATPPPPPTAEVTAPPEAPPVIREVLAITNTETISSVLPGFTDRDYRQATSLENRVFIEGKTGAKLVLSEVAYNQLRSTLGNQITPEMDEKTIATLMADALSKSIWAKNLIVLEKAINFDSNNTILINENGGISMIRIGSNEPFKIKIKKTEAGNVIIIDGNGTKRFDSLFPSSESWGSGPQIFEKDGRFILATTDGYQILATLNKTDQGYTWQKVPPDQLQEFKVLTPEQQIKQVETLLRNGDPAHADQYSFSKITTTSTFPPILILTGGINGFTKQQANDFSRWINAASDYSPLLRQILETSDVRFIARNQRLNDRNYRSAPDWIESVFGIEQTDNISNQQKDTLLGKGKKGAELITFFHEVGRIYYEKIKPNGLFDDRSVYGLQKRLYESVKNSLTQDEQTAAEFLLKIDFNNITN